MEVTKGFKQTELGILPVDWEVKPIGLEIDLLTGFPFPSLGYSKSGIRLLRCSNIKRGVTDWSEGIVQYWPKLTPELRPYILNAGDIVIAMDGSLVGKSFARLNTSDLPAILLQRVARIRSNKIYLGYLKEFICSEYFTKYCDTVKTSSAIPHISPGDIKGFRIPIPPTIIEQTAIATTLSNIDELISETEMLIVKKKAIKQGVMQELLKPKEGWVTKLISEVCWFQEGPGVRKHQFTQSGVKLLNGTNIQEGKLDLDNTDKFIAEEEAFGWYSHFLVDENDILIACSGVSIDKFHEKVTVAKMFHLPLCMNTSTMRFKVKKGVLDQGYFIQFLKSKRFKEQISGKATGSAQLNFGPSHVTMVEIDLPSIETQNIVGKVLSDMEKEIEIFESKLQKLKHLKQGMVHALLTGKIRLV